MDLIFSTRIISREDETVFETTIIYVPGFYHFEHMCNNYCA